MFLFAFREHDENAELDSESIAVRFIQLWITRFRAGDLVEERGGTVRGYILGPGKFAGEWKVKCVDERKTT